ncbi:MAG: hypothetical protein LBF97_06705 [Elusimicrobiota bacterium]|jgi:sulfatase maturation enzyme AslB (radical SAM superfamily)|nr:hypothetical protein [Elusimicrobiota bacterium]
MDKNVINIILTNKCNGDCKYCYLKNKYEVTDINNIHIDKNKIIELTSGISESFTNVDKLYQIVEIIRKNDNVLKELYLYTNGIIDNKNVENFLIENRDLVRLKISLDGPKEENDKYRIDVYGNGMYDRTIEFIRKYKKYVFSINGVIAPKHNIKKCMWFLYDLCLKNDFTLLIVPMLPVKKWNKKKLLYYYNCLDKIELINLNQEKSIRLIRICGDITRYKEVDKYGIIQKIDDYTWEEAFFDNNNWIMI